MSIFLHDKASGGAGFSVKAQERFADLLRNVERILDCRVEGCVRGCPACVLVGDLNDQEVARLDRLSALALIRDRLQADGRPEEQDRATGDARFCLDLLDEIRHAMEAGGTRITFRLGGPIDLGALAAWDGAPVAGHWVSRGRDVVLGLDPGAIAALNGAERLQLRDFVNRRGVRLEEGHSPALSNGAQMIAEVIQADGRGLVFASRDDGAWSATGSWGQPAAAPIVRFLLPSTSWQGAGVDVDQLGGVAGAAVRHFANDLDGPIVTFGERAAVAIRTLIENAGIAAADKVTAMTYEDRYLRSPVALRLCLETLSHLRAAGSAPIPLTVRTLDLEASARPQQWLDNDWQRENDRTLVASIFAKAVSLTLDWRLGSPGHGRRLSVEFASGRRAVILFDQGFGAWRSDRGARFDFHASPAEQARILRLIQTGVRLPSGSRTYIVAEAAD